MGYMRVTWNQLEPVRTYGNAESISLSRGDGIWYINGTLEKNNYYVLTSTENYINIIAGHQYYIWGNPITDGSVKLNTTLGTNDNQSDFGNGVIVSYASSSDTVRMQIRLSPGTYDFSFIPQMVDLTLMFGEGHEPSIDEFKVICALNGMDLTQYQPINLGTVKEWKVYSLKVASGDIASFNTNLKQPMDSLKAIFLPKQDLHGYSRVWPAGGGKNKFNVNATFANPSSTIGSNTAVRIFTPGTYCVGASWSNYWNAGNVLSYSISNGTIEIMTAAGYGIGFALELEAGSTYITSATQTPGAGEPIGHYAFYDVNGNYLSGLENKLNVAVTIPADTAITVIVFTSRSSTVVASFSDIQVEKASTATSYEPYENICPITGWTGFNVFMSGENLFSPSFTSPTTLRGQTITLNNNGTVTVDGTIESSYYLELGTVTLPAGTYILSGTPSNGGTGIGRVQVTDYPVVNNLGIDTGGGVSFTLSNAMTVCVRLQMYATVSNMIFSPMIRKASVAHKTIPVDWTSQGTIYGGYVDLVKGQLVTEYAEVDLGSLSWTIYSNQPNYKFYATLPLAKVFTNSEKATALCSQYECIRFGSLIDNDKHFSLGANNSPQIRIHDSSYYDATEQEFKSAMNGVQLIYELDAPVIYQLTPQQIRTLTGTNNIWSDANDIVEASYYMDESFKMEDIRRQILLNTPHIENESGNIASFNTDMVAPLKSCKVNFLPMQEGSGDPSPTNVRPITGWTGVNLYHGSTQQIADATTYPISWTSEGIIYGGHIDLVKGELVSEWIESKIADLNWHNYASKIHWYASIIKNASLNRLPNTYIYSDTLTPRTDGSFSAENVGDFTYFGEGTTYANYYNYIWMKTPEAMEYNNANAWFKETYPDAKIYYKTANPITYQLTPQTIKTLKGINNIWSDSNSTVEIEYYTH